MEDASSSTLAFLMAGIMFTASVGVVVWNTRTIGEEHAEAAGEVASYTSQATALLDLLLESPGYSSYDGASKIDWLDDDPQETLQAADKLQRLGLREAGSKALDFSKLENLKSAPYAAADDGFVNYEEAVEALGLDDQYLGFHVRAYPTLRTVTEILATTTRDPNLRVSYIGDALTAAQQQSQSGGSVPTVSAVTCAASPLTTQAIRLSTTLTNTGTIETQFHVAWDVTIGGDSYKDTQRGDLVGPGATVSNHIDLAIPEECDEITSIELAILDPSSSLVTDTSSPSFAVDDPGDGSDHFVVDPSQAYYTTSETVKITFDGGLTAQQGGSPGETIVLTIIDSLGNDVTPAITNPITVPKKNDDWEFETFSAGSLGAGLFDVFLTRTNGDIVSDKLLITTGAVSDFVPTGGTAATSSHAYTAAAVTEIEFLEGLVDRFCPYVWDSQTESPMSPVDSWSDRCDSGASPAHSPAKAALGHYGDILPDDKSLLKDELPDRLFDAGGARFDITNVLVVGSNVDHNTMTANAVKGSIKDWVLAGGTLIVFGSEKNVVNWLQPIFKAKIESSSGGITAPDGNHPLLQVADALAWDGFNELGRAWDLDQGGHDAAFTKVVADSTDHSILAISDPGAYGTGTVILTSWLPYDIFQDGTNDLEGMKLINNLLMQGYRDLFLDYGPEIPSGVQVVPAVGRTQVYHPELEKYVALNVEMFLFPYVN